MHYINVDDVFQRFNITNVNQSDFQQWLNTTPDVFELVVFQEYRFTLEQINDEWLISKVDLLPVERSELFFPGRRDAA